MSTASVILFILAGAALLWQLTNVAMGVAMVASGKYRNVTMGYVPLLLSAALAIIGYLVI